MGAASISKLAVALALVAGCAGGSPDRCDSKNSPCPWAFDLVQWCTDHAGACTVDGQVFAKGKQGDEYIMAGQTIAIPIAEFADQLGSRKELRVGLMGAYAPPSDAADARIDGVAGQHFAVPYDGSLINIRWVPFPSSPQLLELSTPPGGTFVPMMGFIDGPCDEAHPPPLQCGI